MINKSFPNISFTIVYATVDPRTILLILVVVVFWMCIRINAHTVELFSLVCKLSWISFKCSVSKLVYRVWNVKTRFCYHRYYKNTEITHIS